MSSLFYAAGSTILSWQVAGVIQLLEFGLIKICAKQEFEVSTWTLGVEAGWILNMKVQRNFGVGTLHVSQPSAIEKLAAQFKLTENVGRGPWVPMDPHLKLDKAVGDDSIPPHFWDDQSALGALLHLPLTARPDIAQCVGVLSRFMSCPGEAHVTAAKQVIKYLYATKDHGITYTRGVQVLSLC
jgi:hypothetical protein